MNTIASRAARFVGLAKRIYILVQSRMAFRGSESYWNKRYKSGGNSGDGSYNKLSEFKAEVLNDFVVRNDIQTVIEYGCGDGNQLRLSRYPFYIGFDISRTAISLCNDIFHGNEDKVFMLMSEYGGESAELTLSLDVIYHLVEDDVFTSYMERLFDSSKRFVIIYASDTERQTKFQPAHVRNRKFSQWIDESRPSWKLIQHIPNKFPFDGVGDEKSISDFYIYESMQ